MHQSGPLLYLSLPKISSGETSAYSKLESDILMMEPAEDWNRFDAANVLDPAIRSIFLQREMGPDLIVVRSVSLQDNAQVRFAEHDEVVERFATYRSD